MSETDLHDKGLFELPKDLERYSLLMDYLQRTQSKDLELWRQIYRWYCANDIFFLMNFCLSFGRNLHNETKKPLFFHEHYLRYARLLKWQMENEGGSCHSFRSMGKSTWRTAGLSIQLMTLYSGISIALFSWEKQSAEKWMGAIMAELETNSMLKGLFPEVFWQGSGAAAVAKEARAAGATWSRDGGRFDVKRDIQRQNGTFEIFRFREGTPTGSRFDVIHFDDAEDEKVVKSDENMGLSKTGYSAAVKLLAPSVVPNPMIFVTNTWFHPKGLSYWVYEKNIAIDPRKGIAFPGEDTSIPGEGPLKGTAQYPQSTKSLWFQWDNSPDKSNYGLQIALDFKAGRRRVLKEEWLNFYEEDPAEMAASSYGYVVIDPSRGSGDPTVIELWGTLPGLSRGIALIAISRTWIDATTKEWDAEVVRVCHYAHVCCKRFIEVRVESQGQSTFDRTVTEALKANGITVPVVRTTTNLRPDYGFVSGKLTRQWDRLSGPGSRGQFWLPALKKDGGIGLMGEDQDGNELDIAELLYGEEWGRFPRATSGDILDGMCLLFEPDDKIIRAGGQPLQFPVASRKTRKRRGKRSWMAA